MHAFQPISIDLLEFNPFTKIGKEWALVTAGTKGGVNCMTISWGGMGVMWGKDAVFVFVRDSRYTKEFIDKNEFFSLSFLGEEYRKALNYCGSHSGREGDKLAAAGLHPGFRYGIPYIDEGNLILLCRKLAATRISEESLLSPDLMKKWYPDKDMHTMYVAEIIAVMAR